MSAYDGIVIGGGHNGLVAAAYLARAGKKVCVLERRHVLGGCASTEELWPGYKVSPAAYVISLFLPRIIRDLDLNRHGLTILPRNPASFTPALDGRGLMLGSDAEFNRAQINPFSSADAEAFGRYENFLEEVARIVEPMLMAPPPNLLPLPASVRRIGLVERLRAMIKAYGMAKSVKALGTNLQSAVELLTGAARPILERWFESDILKATLATDAIIGAFVAPSSPGSAYVLLHHVMGEAGGARGVWGYVRGGMGGLADALEKACAERGVEIRREAEVTAITTRRGAATGVTLADGSTLEARAVASSIDPHWTFEKLLDADEAGVTPEFQSSVANIDYASASLKINLALSGLPRFIGAPPDDPTPLHGTIHVSPTIDYIERAYDEAKYGDPSSHPVLEITMPTTVDDSIAPAGHHLMSMFVQYAPYRLHERHGSWDDIKERFADRCIETAAQYAPNLPELIVHRQVLSPLDMERTYRLTGGNIFQGSMTPHQLFMFRPVAGWSDYATPVQGLYLCGAAAHPGGGVMGACGKNAAEKILKDLD